MPTLAEQLAGIDRASTAHQRQTIRYLCAALRLPREDTERLASAESLTEADETIAALRSEWVERRPGRTI